MKLNRKIAATAFGVLALGAAGASIAGAASAASPSHVKAPAVSRQVTPPAPNQNDKQGADEQGADPTTGPDHDSVQQGDQKGADNESNENGTENGTEKEAGEEAGNESNKNGQTESAHDTDSAHEDGPSDTGTEAG